MARMTIEEMIADLKRRLLAPRWNMKFAIDEWFFPGDVAPHSAQFKYRCKKLYEASLLERQDSSLNRWGYSYRVKVT